MFAVFQSGGKQHRVTEGEVLKIELLKAEPGEEVVFDQVLMVSGDGNTRIGKPTVEGAVVRGEVIGTHKGKKLVIFRFKRRKNIRRKTGHRQRYTQVRITEIA